MLKLRTVWTLPRRMAIFALFLMLVGGGYLKIGADKDLDATLQKYGAVESFYANAYKSVDMEGVYQNLNQIVQIMSQDMGGDSGFQEDLTRLREMRDKASRLKEENNTAAIESGLINLRRDLETFRHHSLSLSKIKSSISWSEGSTDHPGATSVHIGELLLIAGAGLLLLTFLGIVSGFFDRAFARTPYELRHG